MASQTNKRHSTQHPPAAKGSRRMLYIMLTAAVLIGISLVALYPVVMVGAPNTALIKIPRGASSESVDDSLTKYMGKDYAAKVMGLVKLRGTDLSTRHGAYEIQKGTNALSAMRCLTSGGQKPIRITVNGFRSLPLLVKKISEKMEFTPDSLWAALGDTTLLAKYGLNTDNAMAIFVDDTYEIFWTSSPREVIAKFAENYNYLWDDEKRAKAAELNLSPAQVMIIASIVDEETNTNSEKGTIGRLYINRLHKGMPLQADPTVRYALGDFTIKRILAKDLRVQSPYNTYLHRGLPPGPIRTTSTRTVTSILDAPPNDYIYMCAKEDFSGSHNFASSYKEHTENALRYQKALDAQGIKR